MAEIRIQKFQNWTHGARGGRKKDLRVVVRDPQRWNEAVASVNLSPARKNFPRERKKCCLFCFFFFFLKHTSIHNRFWSCFLPFAINMPSEPVKIRIHSAKSLQSCLTLATPRTVVCQAPLSMRFSRQEYRSGCHFLLQGIFPPRNRTCVSCGSYIAGQFFPPEPPGDTQ